MQKRKRMAAAAVCLAAAASIWLLSGCARKIEPITKSSFMLNTFVTVTLYDTDDPDLLNGSLDYDPNTMCSHHHEGGEHNCHGHGRSCGGHN